MHKGVHMYTSTAFAGTKLTSLQIVGQMQLYQHYLHTNTTTVSDAQYLGTFGN